jgi:hypothetical protein
MKGNQLTALIIALLILQGFLSLASVKEGNALASPDVYVGVDVSYGDVAEAKSMIDQVSGFTNLVVVGSTQITWYPNKLTETFQYAYDKGLSFISLTPALSHSGFDSMPSKSEWLQHAKETWGDRLLGFYHLDEPGGRTLDRAFNWNGGNSTSEADNYVEAANLYISNVGGNINRTEANYLDSSGYPFFTSDYAVYWFDYKAGYDTVFAEFGWNYSRQLNVALCRGAAELQNKDWGVMITWTYTEPPYIESKEKLYDDLVLAYDNGAKYIVVFDGNEGWTGGILGQEHLDALRQFWNYVHTHPRKGNPVNERTAFVLPNGYGFGFRGPSDHIWSLWEGEKDPLALNMSMDVKSLLDDYGEKLDIVYDDGLEPDNNYRYNQLLYWNSYSPPPPIIKILSPEDKTYTVNNFSLTFTLNKMVTRMAYSLDGQDQIAIDGNTTLSDLPNGFHNMTVYSKDELGKVGASETIQFKIDVEIAVPFPTTPVLASAAGATLAFGVLVYFKKLRR